MGDITKNLSRSEAACKCECGISVAHLPLVELVQGFVDWVSSRTGRDVGVKVLSWCRCEYYNNYLRQLWVDTDGKEGANTSENSRHTKFDAIDHYFYYKDTGERISLTVVYKYYSKKLLNTGGLALYSWGIHLDLRPGNPWRQP